MEELFDVYDENGARTGCAPRSRCHGDPSLIHRAVHIYVFDGAGERILLQKRSAAKDIQPGKWDTSVGGHVALGESVEAAARRELREELGFLGNPEFWFEGRIRNAVESENITVFRLTSDGPFSFAPDEIDEIRFLSAEELKAPALRNACTPNLRSELDRIFSEFPGTLNAARKENM